MHSTPRRAYASETGGICDNIRKLENKLYRYHAEFTGPRTVSDRHGGSTRVNCRRGGRGPSSILAARKYHRVKV